jgi:hypothetical protein
MLSIFGIGHKKPEPKPFKSHLFHGPYQPCEVYQSQVGGTHHLVARTVHTSKDIQFPPRFLSVDVEDWMFANGYSKAQISIDSSIKIIW